GRMQHIDGRLPVLPVNQVVPVRNDVVDRAACHAERDAAVHATRALDTRLLVREMQDELAVVLDAFALVLGGFRQPLVFHEAGDLSHSSPLAAPLTAAQRQSENTTIRVLFASAMNFTLRVCGAWPPTRRAHGDIPTETP